MAIESINPANGKRLRRFAQATRAAINQALDRATRSALSGAQSVSKNAGACCRRPPDSYATETRPAAS